MPQFSTKHPKREQIFRFDSFHDGFNEEKTAPFLGSNELSACKNLKYVKSKTSAGERVTLKKRQGTTIISNSALPAAADVLACTYYINQSKYILATAAKLYYLDASLDPIEIGSIDGIPTFTEFNSKLIIHDSGITKYWDGTTFDKINKQITDELLGTGDDVEDQFTGTLANLTVEVSTISITFTGTSVAKTITDDGAGNLIGDVNGGGTNTINYTTGAYDFTCSEPPDNATLVEIDYEQVEAAPKSKAGLVRKSRLYTWGDADNLSRLTYTGVNDEKATHSSSDGGYVDIDANDGSDLLGAVNFQTSMFLQKESSLHRIDDYPGDATFKVEKLTDDLGTVSHRTSLFEGGVVSFMSKEGWVAMHPSERYGDIQKGVSISEAFRTNASKFANSDAYSTYNAIDKQLWLALANSNGQYLDYFYVANLGTGGQISQYQFQFGHSCFSYVNGEMLIGGVDGNLYKLDNTGAVFTDNAVEYTNDCYTRTAFTDWGVFDNWKHNKKIYVRMSGSAGVTANLKIYKNEDYTSVITIALTITGSWEPIYNYSALLIYDATMKIGRLDTNIESRHKFDYRSIMLGIEDIAGNYGVEIMGIDLRTALIGDR
jgi:hypothetical protein